MNNPKIQEARLRYENSKELLERAHRIHDQDMNAYVLALWHEVAEKKDDARS